MPAAGLARRRFGRELEKLAQERLDAEVRERAAEERRRQLTRQNRRFIERMAGRVEQTDVLHEPVVRLFAEQLAERLVVERPDVDLGATRAVVLRALEQVDQLAPPVVDADERAVAVDRPRDRMAGDAEVRFDVADQLERIFADAVALVHEREDRRAPALADVEELARPILDALAVVEQHHRAVGGDERAVRVLGEVLVPRGVEQVDVVAVVLELHHARRDRDAALLLELHPVRRGMPRRTARLDRAGKMDRSAVKQQLFGEGRLARVGMADDREGAAGLHRLLQSGIEVERQRNYLHWRVHNAARARPRRIWPSDTGIS